MELKRKHIMFILAFISIFGSLIVGIVWSLRVESSIKLMRINLIIIMVTLISNLVIWIFGFVTYSYAEDLRERGQKFQNQAEEWEERLNSAGLTLDKLSKFEPLLDELGEVTEDIDVDKLSRAIEDAVELLDDYNDMKNNENNGKTDEDFMEEIVEESDF